MSEQYGPHGERTDGPSWAGGRAEAPLADGEQQPPYADGPSRAGSEQQAPPTGPYGTRNPSPAGDAPHPETLPGEAADGASPPDSAFAKGVARITGSALAPYQTAIVRIGFAATWLFFLLRELPHRHELYGPDGPWGWNLADRLIESNHAFTVLLWTDSTAWFEFVYVLAILSSVTLLIGWRSRTSSVLFMIGVLSLQNRSVFMGDGGDNVIHLMAMYLVLTRCGQVWSLDARRLRRRGGGDGRAVQSDATGVVLWAVFGAVMVGATALGGLSIGWGLFFWALWASQAVWRMAARYAPHSEARTVCDMLANLVHNAALLVIVVEVCLIYSTAGWYKIQGSRWQDGTAVYYPMNLDYFSPWPELNSILAGSGLLMLLITYGTVAVQVAFPFALFNRRVKNVLLAAMITEHVSIAVLLGLPFFSMAMVAADAVFLPTAALLWMGARASGGRKRLLSRLGRPGAGADGSPGADGESQSAVPRQRSGENVSVR
ncbi:HTTM domain-containing protein [Streptomyces daqingensis]|uniref:HTTM domain-containing protein n=1 Tax=Streptomyces daqingensis TaxID=1472640 RepID=A0ABQ2MAH2_9ACTN|nr:HTTM domain-containing protein [Streptomyces daqingensis]